jgi:hypothetical protein
MGIMDQTKPITLDDLRAAILRSAQNLEKAKKSRSLMAAIEKTAQQFNSGSAHPPRFLPEA